MRVVKMFSHTVAMILMLVSVCCMIVLIMSMFKLPDISIEMLPDDQTDVHSEEFEGVNPIQKDEKLGKFGEMMVEMLPDDLAFTVFVPSEKAFERDLRLKVNHSLSAEEWDNTYATVSHVLGFSTVPRKIFTDLIVPGGKEVTFESISGFTLHVSKDLGGALVVNRVRSERVDIEKGEVVVHVMDGIIMDAAFQQSVLPDEDE